MPRFSDISRRGDWRRGVQRRGKWKRAFADGSCRDSWEGTWRRLRYSGTGGAGWRWVLASMLMLARPSERGQPRPSERGQPVKGEAMERRVMGDTVGALRDVTVGMPLRVMEVPKVRKKMARFVRDSV